jgi:Trypsin
MLRVARFFAAHFSQGRKFMKRILATLAASACIAAPQGPALAVTDGELDAGRHPQVGLLVFQVLDASGKVLGGWRCSGTQLSSTIIVTAGHCTFGADAGLVWFDDDVDAGRPGNGYPFTYVPGSNYRMKNWATHPDFPTASFVFHDVGMVELLDAHVATPYGVLPAADQLDKLKTGRGKQDVTFTAVGYGLQQSFPDAVSWKNQQDRVRMLATPKLNQINVPGFTGDFSLLLSNNTNTGGTCFGDSGGPNFLNAEKPDLVIAGVTSFGINGNCAGTGGVFRLDRPGVLEFITDFIATPYSNF